MKGGTWGIYDYVDPDILELYQRLPSRGFSFAAYDRQECVGIVLSEPRQWNRSLWVYEIHDAGAYRRQGIGRMLMEALDKKASAAGLRILVCETQNTNVPAILFYRKMGFEFEGIDLSYYSNADFPEGEIALFMKKRLDESKSP